MTPPPPDARQTGRFRFDVPTGKWDWDDEVFRIHGYEPGTVEPSTELVLGHKHPDDRARVKELPERLFEEGGPFSIAYRLVTADDAVRRVVMVGETAICEPGAVDTIDGFYIDLTDDFEDEASDRVTAAVEASAEHRASIEQAKGALMFAYGLDPDQAFAMLRWWSRNRNIKVRDLAVRLVELAGTGEASDGDLRGRFDALLHDISVD